MRKLTLLATLAAALLTPAFAPAMGPKYDQYGFRVRPAPRAAPWFLYWPYGAYWQTPAPTGFYTPYAPMTAAPYYGQIGPAAGPAPLPVYGGPTGFSY
jgi:hypothetical protein